MRWSAIIHVGSVSCKTCRLWPQMDVATDISTLPFSLFTPFGLTERINMSEINFLFMKQGLENGH